MLMSEILNIVVSGVGGQGTVLAGKLLANCALQEGAFVRSAETIGMAQRGGSVLGHVRILSRPLDSSDNSQEDSLEPLRLNSPLVNKGQAQLLIGFEPAETLKAYALCAPGALVVSATTALLPPTASLQRLKYDGSAQLQALKKEAEAGNISTLSLVDNARAMTQLGFDKALNVVLLGTALAALEASPLACSALSYEAMQRTIETTVKSPFVQPNLQALHIGYQLL